MALASNQKWPRAEICLLAGDASFQLDATVLNVH